MGAVLNICNFSGCSKLFFFLQTLFPFVCFAVLTVFLKSSVVFLMLSLRERPFVIQNILGNFIPLLGKFLQK